MMEIMKAKSMEDLSTKKMFLNLEIKLPLNLEILRLFIQENIL